MVDPTVAHHSPETRQRPGDVRTSSRRSSNDGLPARHPGRARREETSGSLYGLLALIGIVGAFVLLVLRSNVVGGVGIGLALLLLAAVQPLMSKLSQGETFDLRSIMLLGFAARLIGAYFRFTSAADAIGYHDTGTPIAAALRSLDIGAGSGRQWPGTGALDYLSGIAHVISFDDFFGAAILFTGLSFVGACMFYRAFTIGVPDGDRKRYALLVFLLPTLAYWPSSLGKDGWMQLGIGLSALGIACLFNGRVGAGLIWTTVGAAACTLVRPHVALIVAVGAGAAALSLGSDSRVRGFKTGARVFILVLLIMGGGYAMSAASGVLKIDEFNTDEVNSAFNYTEQQTGQGGSAFTPVRVRTPLDYPLAAVTVLYRPFPFEAHDVTAYLAAGETMFLFLLSAASWRRLRRLPRLVVTTNYLAFSAAFVLVFVFAFSSVSNFGILARQRAQALPLLLVLLCIPSVKAVVQRGQGPRWRMQQQDGHETTPSKPASGNRTGASPLTAGPGRGRESVDESLR